MTSWPSECGVGWLVGAWRRSIWLARRGRGRQRCSSGRSATWGVKTRSRRSRATSRRRTTPSAFERRAARSFRSIPVRAVTLMPRWWPAPGTQLDPPRDSLVMLENGGNLVCPALFDLGELAKVVIISVTEGDDKPIKYPHMIRASQLMLLNKIDLLPHVQFNVEKCIDHARRVNPKIQIIPLSATRGDHLEEWYRWLRGRVAQRWPAASSSSEAHGLCWERTTSSGDCSLELERERRRFWRDDSVDDSATGGRLPSPTDRQ